MKVSKLIKYLQDLEQSQKDIDVEVKITHGGIETIGEIQAVVYNGLPPGSGQIEVTIRSIKR